MTIYTDELFVPYTTVLTIGLLFGAYRVT